jgi:hypothetical protein
MKNHRSSTFPAPLQAVLDGGLLERLPITFRPSTNQQLAAWNTLFPYEQQNLERMLVYLGSLDAARFNALFQGIRQLETLMQVDRWNFSTQTLTLLDASMLARSPYYLQWRQAVERVFDQITRESKRLDRSKSGGPANRLVLILLPADLPLDAKTAWKPWHGAGRELALATPGAEAAAAFLPSLFSGSGQAQNIFQAVAGAPGHAASDLWAIDAGSVLDPLLNSSVAPAAPDSAAVSLNFATLKQFRQGFLGRLNSMRKDLSDADSIYAELRKADVSAWCPHAIRQNETVVEFLRTLFLSGNGALIFGNSFVEWTAAEAFRRARPRVLVACMGTRQKPKPFTSVAVFENQEIASPLPSAPDLPGSAMDASMLAHYVWLAASRYSEYDSALCLCLHPGLSTAYAVGPGGLPLWNEPQPFSVEKLRQHLIDWVKA